MADTHLILTIPFSDVTATSLGIAGFARHLSPGSGKYFRGKAVMADLAVEGGRPAFRFYEEGGWRDPDRDAAAALAAVRAGKRTKTALSNNAFSVTPLSAWRRVVLVKTGGEVLELGAPAKLLAFAEAEGNEGMTADQVAAAIGRPVPAARAPRLLMVLAPIQLLVMTNLLPEEYAWYATHRPGKIFRQVVFAELSGDQPDVAAASRYDEARRELREKPGKKTKSIVFGEVLNDVPFRAWAGYRNPAEGGLYAGDRGGVSRWPFPASIPRDWDDKIG